MNISGWFGLFLAFFAAVAVCASGEANPRSPRVGAAGWTDVTSSPLDFNSNGLPGRGVAWGDFDGDGDPDLIVSHHNHLLFKNEGGGGFAATGLGFSNDAYTAVWGDADNDGDLDLYTTAFELPLVWRNTGGTLSPVQQLGDMGKGGEGGVWGDYDRDGYLDLIMNSFAMEGGKYRNDGAMHFTVVDRVGAARAPQWIDYDGDGELNVHKVDPGSRVSPGTFPPPPDDGDAASVGAWGDYDRDGDPDLYLAKHTGTNRLLHNDGAAGFVDVTAATPLGLDGDSPDASWVDADNDGDLDLFVLRRTAANRLFRNDGGTFTDAGSSALDGAGLREAAAWADFDGDGDLDVFMAGSESTGRLIRNDLPASGHWLHVDLDGVHSNHNGIGARIHVKSGGVWQMHDVAAGNGHSQNSLTAEFGLGSATVVDSIVVQWRHLSSYLQTVTGVAADQRITLVESGVTAVPGPTLGPRTALLPPSPNPSHGTAMLRFDLVREVRVRLDVVDLTGRKVRSLADRELPPGRHEIGWDGRDEPGAMVPAGIYWVRLEAGALRQARRLVRLR